MPDDSTPEFVAGGVSGSEVGIAVGAALGSCIIGVGFGAAALAFLGAAFLGAAFLGAAFFGAAFFTTLVAFAFAFTFFFAFTGRDFFALFLAVRFTEPRLAFAAGRFDLRFFDLLFFAMIILLLETSFELLSESSPEKVCCHL